MNPRHTAALLSFLGLFLLSHPVWAWFAEGHENVAITAADDLTPTARSHVAQILGGPDDTSSIEKAMSAASIRPDTEPLRAAANPFEMRLAGWGSISASGLINRRFLSRMFYER
jgi:hypothetical protein